jgi:hypothetical protein
MARDLEQPEVLHASDTVDTTEEDDPTIVRETRPAAVPADEAVPTEDTAPATYAERTAVLYGRHRGMQLWADFLGFTVAFFLVELFLGLASLAGYRKHAQVPTVGSTVIPNLFVYLGIGSLVGVFLAYLIGGYAAGRMARFDGIRNGIGVWLWSIVVACGLSIAGWILDTIFNIGITIHMKGSTGTQAATIAALIAVTAIVALLGAVIGGRMGERYHRLIDREGEAL